ncbi:2-hydroxyacid dehydrogenase [Luteococcus peritonei]|uniref:2-hydroxyacid dehydrogenase n=1 Tax=Luteococcus peritonei TaxID=88874 RepID=A0ABW4RSS5_9ACTN
MPGFRVGVSADFLSEGRNVWGDIGLGRLDEAGIDWEYMASAPAAFSPEDLAPYDAVLFAAPAVTADSFREGTPSPLLLARFGVGYDAVDLTACTRQGVAVTITPDGARRPVATAALALLLAVLHNLVAKDRLVREHRWAERTGLMGTGLNGLTIGLMGVGNTGGELVRLLAPFDVTVVGFDPFCPAERAAELGVELVDREELARRSDALVVMAALTPDTHHFVDADFLSRMRPTSVVLNVARGPIVDEQALIAALTDGTIRAAGLDVFEEEPQTSGIEQLDNVTLAPHSLAWTSEMSLGNGNSCIDAILAVSTGQEPSFVVNREVLTEAAFTRRLAARR